MRSILLLIVMLLLTKCSNQQNTPLFRCDQKADIVFLVDNSGSIGLENFQNVRDFLATFTLMLNSSDARFGLVHYADSASKLFDLDTYSNLLDLQNAILSVMYTAGSTATHLGLQKLLDDQMFSTARGGREDAPDVVITLTDGISNFRDLTAAAAQQVKALNVTMIAIGVGNSLDDGELGALSSKPEYILRVKDYPSLMTMETPLSNVVVSATLPAVPRDCSGTTIPTTTSTTTTPTTTTTTTTPTTTTTTTTPTTTTTTTTPTTTTTTTTPTTTTTTTTPTTTTTTTTTTPTTTTTTTTPTTTSTTPTTTTTTPTTTTTTTTPTTTTTTTPFITTAPIPVIQIDMLDICYGRQFVRGVAHVPYPDDCSKVIQCYNNPYSNKTLAVIRRCPLGHFWNQQSLDCEPSWTVNCPYERCLKVCDAYSPWDSATVFDDGTLTYPMSGKRRGYYTCIDGKSYPRCCPVDSVYVPMIGCYRARDLGEECGPEESCKEGVSVCKKLPVWTSRISYLENSLVLGYYSVSCIYSQFDVVHCRCDGENFSEVLNNATVCAPFFQTQPVSNCSEEVYDRLLVLSADLKYITFKLTVSLPSPYFQVLASPLTNCTECYTIRIWGDLDTLNFAFGNKRDGVASQATLLWKNATGNIDFVAMVHGTQLTFGASQGARQVVTTVEAFWNNKSFTCALQITAESGFKNTCILNKFEVFDCPHRFDNLY